MTNFEKVGMFMKTFNQDVKVKSSLSTDKINSLRISLINEELEELKQAILEKNLTEVADAQKQAADSMKAFDLGVETDLSKVMVDQQVSSLGFQLTLNIRNKVLSAYKDIMNMPV